MSIELGKYNTLEVVKEVAFGMYLDGGEEGEILLPSRDYWSGGTWNDVMIANDNLRIEQGDHVIMFLTDKKFITDVERLFQPSPFFL